MKRRRILVLGLLVTMGMLDVWKKIFQRLVAQAQLSHPARTFQMNTTATLAQIAASKGLYFGAAVRRPDLLADPQYARLVVQECQMLVPEWEFKWADGTPPLRPTSETFDFTASDAIATFARSHHLLVRGHTLVWHLSLPEWFMATVTPQNAEWHLRQHIQTVVSRYAGKIHSWDVVNEAIHIEDNQPNALRNTPWFQHLGAKYIDLAFRVAAEADPQALLLYNDYGLEYDTPEQEAKRQAVLKLLAQLKSQGTPIGGFGLQSHLYANETRFNSKKLRQFLADVASLGLQILVTELDVIDQKLPADIAVRDRIVAAVYEDYLNVVLAEPAVTAVITWGLSDRYTWLAQFEPRPDGLPVRPLPFDANLQRKLAWNAIARALTHAPQRSALE